MNSIIERTYEVILPSGRSGKVNVFDMNLTLASNSDGYVQLQDGSWIRARSLTIKNRLNQ